MTDVGRWNLSDLKQLIECATAADGHIITTLRNIVAIMEDEESSNFVLGKVVIINDTESGEEDDDD